MEGNDSVLEKEGYLYKRGVHNTSYKRRYFVMRNKVLKYYQKQKDTNPKGKIMLQGCQIRSVQSTNPKKARFEFEIYSDIFSRVYYLYAEDEQHRQSWIHALQGHVEACNNLKGITNEYKKDTDNSGGTKSALLTAINARGDNIKTPTTLGHHKKQQHINTKKKALNLTISDAFLLDTGISADHSSWRRNLASRAISETLNGYLKIDREQITSDCTGLAFHNEESYVCVSSNAPLSDRINNRSEAMGTISMLSVSQPSGRKTSGKTWHEEYNDSPGQLKQVGTFHVQSAKVNSISWLDDLLLVGCDEGKSLLYRCDPNSDINNEHDVVSTYSHFSDKDNNNHLFEAAPGRWTCTSDVSHVELNPDRATFLTLAAGGYHIWDLSQNKKTLKNVYDRSPLFCASWNLHEEKSRLFVLGGQSNLYAIDLRATSSTQGRMQASWTTRAAHDDVIRKVRWSPLVDAWIASAGDDGVIKIWDLRYGKTAFATLQEPISVPNRILQGHIGGITSLAWSNSHAEVLVSGSSDGVVKTWNLRFGPHYVINSHEIQNDIPVVAVNFSQCNPTQMVSVNTDGCVDSLKMANSLVHHFVNHHSNPILSGYETETKNGPIDKSRIHATPSRDSKPHAFMTPISKAATVGGTILSGVKSSVTPSTTDGRGSRTSVKLTSTQRWQSIKNRTRNQPLSSILTNKKGVMKNTMKFVMDTVKKQMKDKSRMKAEQMIERQLYMRDFEYAYKGLVQLAAELWKDKDYDKMEYILNFVSPVFESCQTAVLESQGEYFSFTTLLDQISRSVPPNSIRLTEPIKSDQQQLQLLRLKLNLAKLIHAQDYKKILLLENTIFSAMKADIKTFISEDGDDTLELLIRTILKHDHVKALDFAQKVGTRLHEMHNFPSFVHIAHLLLSPTIYDNTSSSNNKVTIEQNVFNFQEAIRNEPAPDKKNKDFQQNNKDKDNKGNDDRQSDDNDSDDNDNDNTVSLDDELGEISIIRKENSIVKEDDDDNDDDDNDDDNNDDDNNEHDKSIPDMKSTSILDELRVPKTVFSQLQLAHNIFQVIQQDENSNNNISDNNSTTTNHMSDKEDTKLARYNPYVHTNLKMLSGANPHKKSDDSTQEILDSLLNIPHMPSSVARSVIRIMDEMKQRDQNKVVLSQVIHRVYFSALIQQKHFDKLFVRGTQLVTVLNKNSFAKVIMELLDNVAVIRFTKYMDDLLVQDHTQPWNSVKLITVCVNILTILHACSYLPQGLDDILPKSFAKAISLLQASLKSMYEDPRYKNSKFATGKHPKLDAKEKAKSILAQYERICDGKSQRLVPFHMNIVSEFVDMIRLIIDEV